MTTLSGFVLAGGLEQDVLWSTNLSDYERNLDPGVFQSSLGLGADSTANTQPTAMQRRDVDGDLLTEFGALWYDHLHIIPGVLALGNVLSNETVTVEVFNGYFVQKTLTDITVGGALPDGVGLSGQDDPPLEYSALQSRLYQVGVSASGSPSIDAVVTLTFGSQTLTLAITGTRLVVFPHAPDWEDVVTESFAWLTDVMRSRNGTEQRVELRPNPRRTLEYRTLALEAAEQSNLHASLWAWQDKFFALPIWPDAVPLSAVLNSGASSIAFETAYLDFDAGGLALIWEDWANWEAVQVESVDADQINLVRPTQNTWGTDALVIPLRKGNVQASVDVQQIIPSAAQAQVKFTIQAQEISTNRITTTAATQYRGFDVWLDAPDDSENVSTGVDRDVTLVDNPTGIFALDSRTYGAEPTRELRLWLDDHATVSRFLGWLNRRAGKARPAWVPTRRADFTLTDGVTAIQTQITVEFVGYSSFYNLANSRRDIAFLKADGTWLFRRITGATVAPGGTTEALQLDSALGAAYQPEDFDLICLLELCRLDTDNVEIAWTTDDFAQVAIKVRGLLYS